VESVTKLGEVILHQTKGGVVRKGERVKGKLDEERRLSLMRHHTGTHLLLHAAKGQAGLFYVMAAANSFGAALLSSGDGTFDDVIEAIEKGTIKALLVVESDPFRFFPDEERLARAIEKLELLVLVALDFTA
jgi:Ser-tRNA(Ala) deacylase AlaX